MTSHLHKLAFQIVAATALQLGSGAAVHASTPMERQTECAVKLSGLDLIERRIAAASDPGLFERSTRFDEARGFFNRQAVQRYQPKELMERVESYADGLRQKYRGQPDGLEATLKEATAYANHCYIYYDESVVVPRSRPDPR